MAVRTIVELFRYKKMKKINFYLFIILFTVNCTSQKKCTEEIKIKDIRYLSISKEAYKFYLSNYSNIDGFSSIQLTNKNSDENDLFFANLLIDVKINKTNPNYVFEEKNYKLKKRFKDNHINYFRYNPLTADTLGGKLIESYQKYDSIFIGTHTWYDYELQNNIPTLRIKKDINYDSIYPICLSKAYKIARKKFGKKHINVNAPKDYPDKKQEKDAFWEFYNDKMNLRIDAYSGELINKNEK